MRIAVFHLKCDECPKYVRFEVGDDLFQGKAGDWCIAAAERLGWKCGEGRILCRVHAAMAGA